MRYIVKEKAPRGVSPAPIAEVFNEVFARQVLELAKTTAPGAGWEYTIEADGEIIERQHSV